MARTKQTSRRAFTGAPRRQLATMAARKTAPYSGRIGPRDLSPDSPSPTRSPSPTSGGGNGRNQLATMAARKSGISFPRAGPQNVNHSDPSEDSENSENSDNSDDSDNSDNSKNSDNSDNSDNSEEDSEEDSEDAEDSGPESFDKPWISEKANGARNIPRRQDPPLKATGKLPRKRFTSQAALKELQSLGERHGESREPVGIVGGSSLVDSSLFSSLNKVFVQTDFGRVILFHSTKSSEFGRTVYFCQRHHADPSKGYTPPTSINKKGIVEAFKKVGVKKVIGFASVGGLLPELDPGLVVVPDDYFQPWAILNLYNNKETAIIPGYDGQLRSMLIDILKRENIRHRDSGVYVQTMGPRFETKAEIRYLSGMGHVVGMTGGDEATLFKEGGIGYASLCMVDNYANGVQPAKDLELKDFSEGVKRNMVVVESIARCVIAEM